MALLYSGSKTNCPHHFKHEPPSRRLCNGPVIPTGSSSSRLPGSKPSWRGSLLGGTTGLLLHQSAGCSVFGFGRLGVAARGSPSLELAEEQPTLISWSVDEPWEDEPWRTYAIHTWRSAIVGEDSTAVHWWMVKVHWPTPCDTAASSTYEMYRLQTNRNMAPPTVPECIIASWQLCHLITVISIGNDSNLKKQSWLYK